ncbi:MAG: restriction endonuclease subunit S, partial [Alphaproteobacteria bacterium]|nr:restriction endonuclease subunit S [Alphaproteobacteria bacterium]
RSHKNVSQMYLFRFLKSMENQITGNGGAVFDSINKNQIEAISIPLPSIDDQRRIVAKLEAEQEVIDANKRLIDLMQDKINQVINRIYKCDI